MPELRLNLITGEWVIIATERAKRPSDFRSYKEKRYPAEHMDSCPFCAGNENKTPPEIMRVPSEGGWKVRVTQNKFAALNSEGERLRFNDGLKHSITGVGRHEVIVESPLHNMNPALMDTEDLADVIRVYKNRFLEMYSDPKVEHVIVFKNHGERAGTSIEHPHSQIVGTPVVPFQVVGRIYEAVRYFDSTGTCLVCSTLEDELADGKRIVFGTERFVAVIPYAALSPFHTWIFPKKHSASFGVMGNEDIDDLAHVLKTVLLKCYRGLGNPDYNYVIRSVSPKESESRHLHWYLSIVPRVTQTAGFELGTGMYINTALPEESAEFLRKVKV